MPLGPGTGGSGGSIAPSEWTLFVCDASGNKLSALTRDATNRRLSYKLNRAAQLTFSIKSDTPAALALQPGRIIKGWRREGGTQVLRYCGNIWQLSDEGGEDTFTTSVICYDPFQRMAKRLLRDGANAIPADGKVSFSAVQVETIARNIIDRTNTGGGVSGLRTNATGPTLGTRTVDYEWRDVASVILELCSSSGLNFYVEPEDRTDGYLGYIVLQGDVSSVAAKKLVWGGPLHNVQKVERTQDMEKLANDVRALGMTLNQTTRPFAQRSDSTSITAYGRLESVSTYGDITLQAYLDSLADQEIALRKDPQTIAKFTPQPDPGSPNAVDPFLDFRLGYKIDVFAGASLRGGFSGTQRVWGFDLDLSDDGVERVAAIYTGADA